MSAIFISASPGVTESALSWLIGEGERWWLAPQPPPSPRPKGKGQRPGPAGEPWPPPTAGGAVPVASAPGSRRSL